MFVSNVDVKEEVQLTASPVGFLQTDSMWTSVWVAVGSGCRSQPARDDVVPATDSVTEFTFNSVSLRMVGGFLL